ncbi:MAG: hypothetical protein J7647_08300 [Cyanobacteria bacterium SBLK]|nr:hypothetical protein [Cyanobacteria bacterium SBLK]
MISIPEGKFNGTIDTGNEILSSDSYDIFISKLDLHGNFLWTKQMGGNAGDSGEDISVDSQGNIIVIGDFSGTADFDPSANTYQLTSKNSRINQFILKLNEQGNFRWARQVSTIMTTPLNIAVDSHGDIYSAGGFFQSFEIASGNETYNLSSQGANGYIWKLNASGQLEWIQQIDNVFENSLPGIKIEIDNEDTLYIASSFDETIDFNLGTGAYNLTSYGQSDTFLGMLDRQGNLQEVKQIGGNDSDILTSLALGNRGEVYLIGGFKNTTDFDPGDDTFTLTSPDGMSIFVTKLQPANNTPISVDFNLNKTAYRVSQTLTITSGNVSDRDGISDLSHIDFYLRYGDGTLIDLSDVTDFTPSNSDNRQGFFNYNLDLSALVLTEGNYSLWATIYDRNGMASEVFEQNFIIGEIPNFDPAALSFALNADSYLDTDTLSLDSGEVKEFED